MVKFTQRAVLKGAVAFLVAGLAFGALPVASAGLYKWTDDQGAVHYSDQMPADAVNKGGVIFDRQGHPLKKIDPTLTPAQQKVKDAEDERLRIIAKTEESKTRRDVALVHSYTSEEEIDFARNRALQAVDSQLKSAETFTADLTKRQQQLTKDKAAYGTKPVPATLDNELSGLDEELARQEKVLAQRRAEITAINAKYEADKQRWRELKTDTTPAAAATPSPPQPATPTPRRTTATSSVIAK
jgi:Domain of unknown function (DUF4124)